MADYDPIEHLSEQEDPCPQCGHTRGDHIMKSGAPAPLYGWMVCPVEGCECWSTWAVSGMSSREVEEKLAEFVRETGIPLV